MTLDVLVAEDSAGHTEESIWAAAGDLKEGYAKLRGTSHNKSKVSLNLFLENKRTYIIGKAQTLRGRFVLQFLYRGGGVRRAGGLPEVAVKLGAQRRPRQPRSA